MQSKHWLPAALLCAAALPTPANAAITEATFLLQTTGDLVEVCSAAPTDPMGTAALNFCHGFVLGVYRVLDEENAARRIGKLFCLPATDRPSRNEAIAEFVQWAKGNPDVLQQQPANGLALYLTKKYACPRGQ